MQYKLLPDAAARRQITNNTMSGTGKKRSYFRVFASQIAPFIADLFEKMPDKVAMIARQLVEGGVETFPAPAGAREVWRVSRSYVERERLVLVHTFMFYPLQIKFILFYFIQWN